MTEDKQSQVLTQKDYPREEKRVGVLKDQNGDVFLFAPKGYYLTLQTNDWMLFKVTLAKL